MDTDDCSIECCNTVTRVDTQNKYNMHVNNSSSFTPWQLQCNAVMPGAILTCADTKFTFMYFLSNGSRSNIPTI